MVMRSYVAGRSDYNTTDAIAFDVNLSRMENRTAVREAATSVNGFLAPRTSSARARRSRATRTPSAS
ncbi:hypothetical protein [Streptomyces sp. NPDC060002]|uniref:hypothetical protein n=1 Tax=Streptomyces sp. NPDC060002 TaxID=3347033 RepID=UPI0036C40662